MESKLCAMRRYHCQSLYDRHPPHNTLRRDSVQPFSSGKVFLDVSVQSYDVWVRVAKSPHGNAVGFAGGKLAFVSHIFLHFTRKSFFSTI
jgi:hypothetical protein